MTKSDFIDWKQNPVTKEVFQAIQKECYEIAVNLARVAGSDPTSDRYQSGVIRGMERLLEVEYEGEEVNDQTP